MALIRKGWVNRSDPQGGVIIYTDGACKGNPGPGGWGVVFSGPDGIIREVGAHIPQTTNNRMEMQAVLEGLKLARAFSCPVTVLTDSSYVISGMCSWTRGWIKNGWLTAAGREVLNKDLWQQLLAAASDIQVRYIHVRGHTGVPGNERADQIASGFAESANMKQLFAGPLTDYSLDLSFGGVGYAAGQKNIKGSRAAGIAKRSESYYISLVEGNLKRHESWKSCQMATCGVSGAKFRKVKSREEENQILKSWGY